MRPIFSLAVLLSGCDYAACCAPSYNLAQPIRFEVDQSLAIALEARGIVGLDQIMQHTAAALGTKIGDSVNPVIRLQYRLDGCTDGAAAETNHDGITFCASGLYERHALLQHLFMHEVGHALGAVHAPCETWAIMNSALDCPLLSSRIEPPEALAYSPADRALICRRAVGGICVSSPL